MITNEKRRIVDYNHGQLPARGYLSFKVETDKPQEKLKLVKDVLLVVSEFNEDNWPADSIWDIKLPKWFLERIKSYSLEDINKRNTLLWDYGSWLDAMKYRGWQWYSSQTTKVGFDVILEPHSFPFSVNPFEYILWESGVDLSAIHFEDHSS